MSFNVTWSRRWRRRGAAPPRWRRCGRMGVYASRVESRLCRDGIVPTQGQANRYIRRMAKDKDICMNGFDVAKLTDKNFLRTLVLTRREK